MGKDDAEQGQICSSRSLDGSYRSCPRLCSPGEYQVRKPAKTHRTTLAKHVTGINRKVDGGISTISRCRCYMGKGREQAGERGCGCSARPPLRYSRGAVCMESRLLPAESAAQGRSSGREFQHRGAGVALADGLRKGTDKQHMLDRLNATRTIQACTMRALLWTCQLFVLACIPFDAAAVCLHLHQQLPQATIRTSRKAAGP